jgi:hypothetical protein
MNQRFRKLTDVPAPKLHVWGDGTEANWYDHDCGWMKCNGKQIVAQIAYDYVTGRAGRISYAQKTVCQEHLAKWLKKNPGAKESSPADYKWCRNNF